MRYVLGELRWVARASLLLVFVASERARVRGVLVPVAHTATIAARRTRETTLAGVPAIVRVPAKITKAPIVLWHGFGPPASEEALMDALPLDDVPAIKVYLGLPLFGKRAEAGGVEALKKRQETDVALRIFEPVVAGAAKELPAGVEALRNDGCARPASGSACSASRPAARPFSMRSPSATCRSGAQSC